MKAEAEKECASMVEEARKAVDKIFAEGRKQCEELSELYEMQAAKCMKIREELLQLEEMKKHRMQEETENEEQI